MSAITFDSSEYDDDFRKTDIPFSLRVTEIAIPVLKSIGVILAGMSLLTLGLIAFAPVSSTSLLVISSAIGSAAAFLTSKLFKDRIDCLSNPEWADYYSKIYQNRSINELMLALPNRNSWTKLNWTGGLWKEKILPYAIANRMDRMELNQEFNCIFKEFDPLLQDYYLQVENKVLNEKGFQELIRRSVDSMPAMITPNQLREALINETAHLSCKVILNQYGALPFDRNYLNPNDLITRFNQETENAPLLEIQNQYPAELLNRGILTTERFHILLNKIDDTYDLDTLEKEFYPFTSRLDWFQSPRIQALFFQKLISPRFSLSRSNLFRYSQDQFAQLPDSWPNLLMELRLALHEAKLDPSPEYLRAKRLYKAQPTYISTYTYTDSYNNPIQFVINPMKSILLTKVQTWERIDRIRQEEAYQKLDNMARQKISLLNRDGTYLNRD